MARLLAGPRSTVSLGRRLARKLDATAVAKLKSASEDAAGTGGLTDLKELLRLVDEYTTLEGNEPEPKEDPALTERMELLQRISTLALDLDGAAIKLKEDAPDDVSLIGALKKLQGALKGISKAALAERERFYSLRELAAMRKRRHATFRQLGKERPELRYLMISAAFEEARATELYPPSVPLEQQYLLSLPPSKADAGKLKTDPFAAVRQARLEGAPAVDLEVLVVAGGHGGFAELFGPTTSPFLARDWEKIVIGPLLAARISARFIVLDACLTATMVPVFSSLVKPGGKIICSTVSIPTRFVDPDTWQKLLAELKREKPDVGDILMSRLAALHQKDQGSYFGVYDPSNNTLKVDVKVAEDTEFRQLRATLESQPGKPTMVGEPRAEPQ